MTEYQQAEEYYLGEINNKMLQGEEIISEWNSETQQMEGEFIKPYVEMDRLITKSVLQSIFCLTDQEVNSILSRLTFEKIWRGEKITIRIKGVNDDKTGSTTERIA